MQAVTITQINFEDLHKLIEDSIDKSLSKAFAQQKSNGQNHESDHWMDLSELCKYLPDKPTLPTVYGWVSKKVIPYHKGGKKLRFLQSEIDQWLKQGRRKTHSEIEAEAQSYLTRKKG